MSLRRIFSDQPLRTGARQTLKGDAANHVLRVLRLRRGDGLVVFDGSGSDFEAEITDLGRNDVTVLVGTGREIHSESPLQVTLLQGVCRGPRMDTVIQKATELGVTRIQPVLTERSVVRLDEDRADRKQEHWQRVAIAAAEQSGRGQVPVVAEPDKLETIIPGTSDLAIRLLLDPAGESLHGAAIESAIRAARLGLLVGPEGGLTPEESRLARDFGFRAIRLGPRILRTETAPLAALAVLQFMAGDF